MTDLGPSPVAAGDRQLSLDEARRAIAAMLRPIDGTETVTLLHAPGRVLAADLASTIDVPAHDNSAMDGYAFDGAALASDGETTLAVAGTVVAGAPHAGRVAAGACLRIMTGAMMPAGTDTVVPLELCRETGDGRIAIGPGTIRVGENRRRRGEDLSRGQPALRAGRVLKPADVGLVASLGIGAVTVVRRLRVAVFSTGDELRAIGQPLDPGCVYDSNRPALVAALQRLGAEIVDLGLVRDDPAALRATMVDAIRRADAVITSGGVSAGDADHTRTVMAEIGEVAFWKVAMRPGRPFACGPLTAGGGRGAFLFALPGNPVAAMVTWYALVRDALLQLAGATPDPLPVLRARCTHPIRKRPGRTELQRARVEPAEDGWQVRITGSQGAGILRSMTEANALVVLAHGQSSVAAGEPVDVWLFDGLV